MLDISEAVHSYASKKEAELGGGIRLSTFADEAYYLNGRLAMMSENLLLGGILVAVVLGLFLNLKVACWVIIGIPISFAGAFWLMPSFDVTINVMSLFAFIMVLGIVVDDAIVIGESADRAGLRGDAEGSVRRGGDVRGAAAAARPAVSRRTFVARAAYGASWLWSLVRGATKVFLQSPLLLFPRAVSVP